MGHVVLEHRRSVQLAHLNAVAGLLESNPGLARYIDVDRLKDAQREAALPAESVGFAQAAEPLIRWLAENRNPHACVIVDSGKAQLFDGALVHRTDRFIPD